MSDTIPFALARPALLVGPSCAPSAFPAELEADFEPLALLGTGRSGVVWHAQELRGRRQVALKVAARDRASADIEFRRCLREAKVARRLKHRHATSLVSAGEKGDVAYCAWRYCAGGTLAARQAAGELLSVEAVVTIVREIAAALEYAKEQGVWHGALSPQAVLFDSTGRCQVADFRIVVDDAELQEEQPLPARSPTYHAPELRAGDEFPITDKVDQYALALIAYELLTGEVREARIGTTPLLAFNLIDVATERELRHGLSSEVNEALHRATLRDPQWRFESTGEFAEAFATACGFPADRPRDHPFDWTPPREPSAVRSGLRVTALAAALTTMTSVLSNRWDAVLIGVGLREPVVTSAMVPVSPELQEARVQARGRLGELMIVPVTPTSDAMAVVDGIPRGAVPRWMRLTPGEHRVSVRTTHGTLAPAETTVTITPGARITVNFR